MSTALSWSQALESNWSNLSGLEQVLLLLMFLEICRFEALRTVTSKLSVGWWTEVGSRWKRNDSRSEHFYSIRL